MESTTPTPTPTTTPQEAAKSQFAAALRQYQYYSHGRSIRKFCDDEGLDYQKFCKYAREHSPGSESVKQGSGDILPATFIEVQQEAEGTPVPVVAIREIRVRFTTWMILHGRADKMEDILTIVRKMLS